MRKSFAKDESANPTIDVQTSAAVVENQTVSTPVPGVTIETTVTHAAPAAPAITPLAVIVAPPKALVRSSGLVLGDKIPDFGDIILPRINIVHGVGELKEKFQQGALIFGGNLPIFTPPIMNGATIVQPATPPVTMIVLGFRPTRFVEKVVGTGRTMIVDTEEEVTQNGGTLSYQEWELKKPDGMRLFQPLVEALIAVERPEFIANDGTTFTHEVDGKQYALALWGLKGAAYTAAAKRVFFPARALGCLKGGYPTFCFAVSTSLQPSGKNKVWNPVCLPLRKTSEAFLIFVRDVLSAPEAAASGDAE